MRHLLILLVAFFPAFLGSCVPTSTAVYTPPVVNEGDESWSRTIDLPKDEVWDALIDHLSGTFFAIEAFEKDSGLITLEFGSSEPSTFVEGGTWKYRQGAYTDAAYIHHPSVEFEGDYVLFLQEHRAASLAGSMNVFVRSISASQSEVKVRARYVLRAANGLAPPLIWEFNTGGHDEVTLQNYVNGTLPGRKLQPTHYAERSILDAVEGMLAASQ